MVLFSLERRLCNYGVRVGNRDSRIIGLARALYGALREADAQGIDRVIVVQPEGSDIAIAIRDRLGRAAQGR